MSGLFRCRGQQIRYALQVIYVMYTMRSLSHDRSSKKGKGCESGR